MAEIDVERKVRDVLAEAGFDLNGEQIETFVAAYPHLRAAADSLFAIKEIRYLEPATTYRAAY